MVPRGPRNVKTQRAKESVWDYPRPPRVEPLDRHVRIVLGGETIAESDRATAGPRDRQPTNDLYPTGGHPRGRPDRRRRRAYLLRVEGNRFLRARRGGRQAGQPGRLVLPRPEAGLRAAQGSPGLLPASPGRRLSRRRAGRAAAGRLLRRLDHRARSRAPSRASRAPRGGDQAAADAPRWRRQISAIQSSAG